MHSIERITQPPGNVERARQDSRALWTEIIGAGHAGGLVVSVCPERVALNLAGRYQVGDGNEFGCEIRDISPLGFAIKGSKSGRVGQCCTANVVHVGIIEGVVVHVDRETLTLGIIALPIRIQRLARQLRWHFKRLMVQAPDRRASDRIEMKGVVASLKTTDGRDYPCEVFDISDGGAALHLGPNALYVWVDQPIVFDRRPGRVLRHFPGGVVIRFD